MLVPTLDLTGARIQMTVGRTLVAVRSDTRYAERLAAAWRGVCHAVHARSCDVTTRLSVTDR